MGRRRECEYDTQVLSLRWDDGLESDRLQTKDQDKRRFSGQIGEGHIFGRWEENNSS